MILQVEENSVQFEPTLEKSPAHVVFRDALRELYWSKNKLMRTLLSLENAALNGSLKRMVHDYFEATRIQGYGIEHIFELLDESPEGRVCPMTEASCDNAFAMLRTADKAHGTDKRIRSCVAEFFAHEITSLEYLLRLATTMQRVDIARILNGMKRRTHTAFESAFPAASSQTVLA